MQRICDFADKFHLATDEMINPNSDFASCMLAIQTAANAAQLCETASEQMAKQAELISPAFYLLGGFIGLLIGIPLGIAGGIVVGICALFFAVVKDSTSIPTDPIFLKIWFGGFAAVGAICCATEGATLLSDILQRNYTSFCQSFRPQTSISELGSSLLSHTIFCNRARFQTKAINQHLPSELADITQEFLLNDNGYR